MKVWKLVELLDLYPQDFDVVVARSDKESFPTTHFLIKDVDVDTAAETVYIDVEAMA